MPKNKRKRNTYKVYSFKGQLYLYDGNGWLYPYDRSANVFRYSWVRDNVVQFMTLVGVNYAPH